MIQIMLWCNVVILFLTSLQLTGGTDGLSNNKQSLNKVSSEAIVQAADPTLTKFLLPTPHIITLLAELMILSSSTTADFSLEHNAPPSGFRYVRHPSSFGVCLIQISNDAFSALLNGHSHKDQIQGFMKQIPVILDAILNQVEKTPLKLVSNLILIDLETLVQITYQCEALARNTEGAFQEVLNSTAEIIEATESRQTYEYYKVTELEQIKAEILPSNAAKQGLENIQKTLRETQTKLYKDVDDYKQKYDEAFKNIPSPWKVITLQFVDHIVNMVANLPKTALKFSDPTVFINIINPENKSFALKQNNGIGVIYSIAGMEIYSELLSFIQESMNKAFQKAENPKYLFEKTYKNGIGLIKKIFHDSSQIEISAKTLLENGEKLCTKVHNLFQNGFQNVCKTEVKEMNKQLDILMAKVNCLLEQATFDANLDEKTKDVQEMKFKYKFCTNGKEKAEMYEEQLNLAEEHSNELFNQMIELNHSVANLTEYISTLNFKNISFGEIIILLKSSIGTLACMTENWSTFVIYFQKLMTSFTAEFRTKLNVFQRKMLVTYQDYGKDELQDNVTGAKENRMYVHSLLDPLAETVTSDAEYIFYLAHSYVMIFELYLLKPLAGLNKMIVANDVSQIRKYRAELKNEMDGATACIEKLLDVKKEKLKSLRMQLETKNNETWNDVRYGESVGHIIC